MTWQESSGLKVATVATNLESDLVSGLTKKQAQERFISEGPNCLDLKKVSWPKILVRQFISPFIYMLIAAAILSFVMSQWLEGAMILVFLLINAGLGFFQEYRSEKTAKLLGGLIAWQSVVVREGKTKIVKASELVPGDLVILKTGDKVSADARILESQGFGVDEASLTGESLPVVKSAIDLKPAASELSAALNIVFSGTRVVSGRAQVMVVATGKKSYIGRIADLSAKTKKVSSFATSISGLSNFILKLVIATLIFVFFLNLFIKGGETNWMELAIFSIALAIGVIPEALPLVMTFSFSSGAMNLAKKKVVIKRLSSIEDLGNIEILCSDKTGTLTEGKLKVFDFYLPRVSKDELLRSAVLACGELKGDSDPFDLSLKKALGKKIDSCFKGVKVLFSAPFDPQFLRNSAVIATSTGGELIVRGAPEVIFNLTSNLTSQEMSSARLWQEEQGRLGRRVLALSKRSLSAKEAESLGEDLRDEEHDLEFLGMISFADNIKKSTLRAIKRAQALDIQIKIISGDSPEVTGAIARQIGLIAEEKEVLTFSALEAMSPLEKEAAILRCNVFARVSPDKKHEIINYLQAKHSVGYLGDGINDAPALKAAGVSLAVNNAADVAREAADVILLENDLNVIIEGIEEGRKIFINSAKYIKATLASNFGNFYAVAIASLLIPFLPMLPLQILLLNLLSDFPMIAIATDNVDATELASPKKYQTRDVLVVAMILGLLSTIFDFVFFALFKNISPGVLQTNWLIASVLTELAFLFSIRTKGFMFLAKRPSNLIFILSGLAVAVTLTVPFTHWGAKIFNFVAPQGIHLVWIFSLVGIYIVCSETIKLIYYRQQKVASPVKIS